MTQVRLPREKRRMLIEQAALRVAQQQGVWNVTHRSVAEACEVKTSTITVKKYFRYKKDLLDAVIRLDSTGLLKADVDKMDL